MIYIWLGTPHGVYKSTANFSNIHFDEEPSIPTLDDINGGIITFNKDYTHAVILGANKQLYITDFNASTGKVGSPEQLSLKAKNDGNDESYLFATTDSNRQNLFIAHDFQTVFYAYPKAFQFKEFTKYDIKDFSQTQSIQNTINYILGIKFSPDNTYALIFFAKTENRLHIGALKCKYDASKISFSACKVIGKDNNTINSAVFSQNNEVIYSTNHQIRIENKVEEIADIDDARNLCLNNGGQDLVFSVDNQLYSLNISDQNNLTSPIQPTLAYSFSEKIGHITSISMNNQPTLMVITSQGLYLLQPTAKDPKKLFITKDFFTSNPSIELDAPFFDKNRKHVLFFTAHSGLRVASVMDNS